MRWVHNERALADRLATHLRKMASGEISESTMLRCMTLLRELLEERGASWANSTEVDKQIGELVQAFSPRALRNEIVQLLGSAFLDPSVFLNARSCVEFMRHLTADLRDKPIVRRATSLEERTSTRLAQGHRFIADRILFHQNEQGTNELVLVARQIEPSSGGEVRTVIPWPY